MLSIKEQILFDDLVRKSIIEYKKIVESLSDDEIKKLFYEEDIHE